MRDSIIVQSFHEFTWKLNGLVSEPFCMMVIHNAK